MSLQKTNEKIASMRETAKMLARIPPAVAIMAMATVTQTPYSPNAGRAAAARE